MKNDLFELLDGADQQSSGSASRPMKPTRLAASSSSTTALACFDAQTTIPFGLKGEDMSPQSPLDPAMKWWERKRLVNTSPCDECGTPFYRSPAHRARTAWNVCSLACAAKYKTGPRNPAYVSGKQPITCAWCGAVKLYNAREAARVKTCSQSCRAQMMWANTAKKLSEIPCTECGKAFMPHSRKTKFCSMSCKDTAHSRNMAGDKNPRFETGAASLPIDWSVATKRDSVRSCEACAAEFKPRSRLSKYCSTECRQRSHAALVSGLRSGRYVHGKANFPYPLKWTRPLKDAIRKRDGFQCVRCTKSEADNGQKLDVHHIDYVKENLAETNLISLCRKCHGKMHGRQPQRLVWCAELSALLRERAVSSLSRTTSA